MLKFVALNFQIIFRITHFNFNVKLRTLHCYMTVNFLLQQIKFLIVYNFLKISISKLKLKMYKLKYKLKAKHNLINTKTQQKLNLNITNNNISLI